MEGAVHAAKCVANLTRPWVRKHNHDHTRPRVACDRTIVTQPLALLQACHLEHDAALTLLELAHAHHHTHGSSVASLLLYTAQLADAALSISRAGFPLLSALRQLRACATLCSDDMQRLSTPLEQLAPSTTPGQVDVQLLGAYLAADSSEMLLAAEACALLTQRVVCGCSAASLLPIETHRIVGSVAAHSRMVRGYSLLVTEEEAESVLGALCLAVPHGRCAIATAPEVRVTAVLIDGDAQSAEDLGSVVASAAGIVAMASAPDAAATAERVHSSGVRILLVQGSVGRHLRNSCEARGLAVVCVDSTAMRNLCEVACLLRCPSMRALLRSPAAYLSEVLASMVRVGYQAQGSAARSYVDSERASANDVLCIRSADGAESSHFVTLLLCGPSKQQACESEECFWESLSKLHGALSTGRVLPGAGVAEVACIKRLELELCVAQEEAAMGSRAGLLRCLAAASFRDAIIAHLSTLLSNAGENASSVQARVDAAVQRWASLEDAELQSAAAMPSGRAWHDPALGPPLEAPRPVYDDLRVQTALLHSSVEVLQLLLRNDVIDE